LSALTAAASLSRLASERLSVPAHASAATVLSVQENTKPCAVYNLTVRSQPEFYANGLLTHNCTWTPADGTSPDRLDALVWALTELTDNFGAAAWIAWAKQKAEAAGPRPVEPPSLPEPEPAPVIPLDPLAARKAARDAMFRTQAR